MLESKEKSLEDAASGGATWADRNKVVEDEVEKPKGISVKIE